MIILKSIKTQRLDKDGLHLALENEEGKVSIVVVPTAQVKSWLKSTNRILELFVSDAPEKDSDFLFDPKS